jgi:hypothetical protein
MRLENSAVFQGPIRQRHIAVPLPHVRTKQRMQEPLSSLSHRTPPEMLTYHPIGQHGPISDDNLEEAEVGLLAK